MAADSARENDLDPERRAAAADDAFVVVDDESGEPAAVEWAAGELVGGRSFEAVAADLSAGGWPADAAERVVEAARQRTRADRGVVTRDDVARGAERRYRRTIANARWIAFGGLPGILIAARNLLVALRGMRGGPRRPDR